MLDEFKRMDDDMSLLPTSDPLEISEAPSIQYQYRTFDGFWAIIKSDSLWLTNTRFSNDDEEERLGLNFVRQLIVRCAGSEVSSEFEKTLKFRTSEAFISCFCCDGDKLSQWRGYSSKGGVAIGLELNRATLFSILRNDVHSSADVEKSDQRILRYSSLRKVQYIPLSRDISDAEMAIILSRWSIQSSDIPLINIDTVAQEQIKKSISYIKHDGFREEDESRLVIVNNKQSIDSCIRYRTSESAAVQVPYVVACCGDPLMNRKSCVIRTSFSDDNLSKELQKKLSDEKEKKTLRYIPKVIDCLRRGNDDTLQEVDDLCFGCSKRGPFSVIDYSKRCRGHETYGLRENNHDIYISQGEDQEKVCAAVRQWIKDNGGKWKVWCEGHLPIREIIIGPCPNKFEVRESIEYYCKHTYWLHDVDIKVSEIPYRQRL